MMFFLFSSEIFGLNVIFLKHLKPPMSEIEGPKQTSSRPAKPCGSMQLPILHSSPSLWASLVWVTVKLAPPQGQQPRC